MDQSTCFMTLYKFRPLDDELSLCRAKEILRSGKFWCSKFWELNDPMEGVYLLSESNDQSVKDVFSGKAQYLICSFSGKQALSNPLMWGYYANGFRGMAIEVEVSNREVAKVEYVSKIPDKWPSNIQDCVRKILTTKLAAWKHEDEFRYLGLYDDKCDQRAIKLGRITSVYFGNPYGDVANTDAVFELASDLRDFMKRRDKLRCVATERGLPCYLANVCDTTVRWSPMPGQ